MNSFVKISGFYSLAYKNIVRFVVMWLIKIANPSGLSANVPYRLGPLLFTLLQSIVKQCFWSVLARSITTLPNHIERAERYFFDCCLQLLCRICNRAIRNTRWEYIKNICLRDNFCQIWVAGAMIWKTYTLWYQYFLETVKKLAKFLEISATPETSR